MYEHDVYPGKSYTRDVIKYHLPFTGDPELLKVRASIFSSYSPKIMVEGNNICFEIINFNMKPEEIKREADQIVNSLESQNQHLTNDLNGVDSDANFAAL